MASLTDGTKKMFASIEIVIKLFFEVKRRHFKVMGVGGGGLMRLVFISHKKLFLWHKGMKTIWSP